MRGAKVKIKGPDGSDVDGTVVHVDTSRESFCEFTLVDGTVLRAKPAIQRIVRLDNEYDSEGNTIYLINSNIQVSIVYIQSHLTKGGKESG